MLAIGCSEEIFRVGRRILNYFCASPDNYKNFKEFDDLFHLVIETLMEFDHESDARKYLKYYENSIENGTSIYIGFCDLMTWVEWHLQNFERAVDWGRKGKKMKEESSIDTSCDCGHNLALALRDSGQIEEALNFFLFGYSLEAIISGEQKVTRGGAFWGNIGRCLMLQGQFDKAIIPLANSFKLVEKDKSASGVKNQGYAAFWIAECLENRSKYEEAYIFYKKAKIVWDQRAPTLSPAIVDRLKFLQESYSVKKYYNFSDKDIINNCSDWINEL